MKKNFVQVGRSEEKSARGSGSHRVACHCPLRSHPSGRAGSLFYTLTTFAVLYGSQHLALGRDLMLNAVLIAAVVACFALPFFGYVADRIGRRRHPRSAVRFAGRLHRRILPSPYSLRRSVAGISGRVDYRGRSGTVDLAVVVSDVQLGYAVTAYLAVMSLVSVCAAFFLGRPKSAALPAGLQANVQVNS
jgi:hypothetical protein